MTLRHMRFFALITAAILVPLTTAQTVKSKGDKTVTVGTNNGNIVVNHYEFTPQALKEFRALGGSVDEWAPTLVPGKTPTDFGDCPPWLDHIRGEEPDFPPNDQLYVIAAGGATGICSKLPCNILGVNDRKILELIPLKNGLGLNATIFARDGKAIVGIDGTTVNVNQNEAGFRPKRPDVHTIEVDDQYNDEVLWVSLENPRFVRVRAHFRDADGTYLEISDSGVTTGAGASVGGCAVNFITMIQLTMPLHWQQ
jgi:hypothetical protein